MVSYEQYAWDQGKVLMGVDEVAYGNLFGPLYIAGVVFPRDFDFQILPGIKDSKQMKDEDRFRLEPLIKEHTLWWSCEEVSPEIIDAETAYHAKYRVMSESINKKGSELGLAVVIMDGNVALKNLNPQFESKYLIKGDSLCKTISAASILAKCAQRRKIFSLAKEYPEYDLENNNGYGTKKHQEAILKYGPTPHHRKSYLKKILNLVNKP